MSTSLMIVEPPRWQDSNFAVAPRRGRPIRERVRQLLRNVEVIRIPVSGSGGLGHQDAVVALMEETASLGFEGTFQMVVDNSTGVMARLPTLLPQLNPHASNQTVSFGSNPLVATELGSFRSSRSLVNHPRYIGVAAASDSERLWTEYLDVANAIQLQPYRWAELPGSRQIQTLRLSHSLDLHEHSLYRPRLIDPLAGRSGGARQDALRNFLVGQFGRTSEGARRSSNLFRLLNATMAGEIEIMPVYGMHHVIFSSRSAGYSRGNQVLENLASGLHSYQIVTGSTRPAVVLVLGVDEEPWHSSFERYGRVALDLDEIDSDELDDAFSTPGIVALRSGRLPRQVFQVIVRMSNLPVGFEGANLGNLVQLMQRPFFSVYPGGMTELIQIPNEDLGYRRVYDVSRSIYESGYSAPVRLDLSQYLSSLTGYLSAESNPRFPSETRQLMHSAFGNGSPLSFQDAREMYSQLLGAGLGMTEAAEFVQRAGLLVNTTSSLALSGESRFFLRHLDLRNVNELEYNRFTLEVHSSLPYGLGRLLVELRDVDSPVSRYFRAVWASASSEERDQVLQAFDALARYL